jgi:hypothetical protein
MNTIQGKASKLSDTFKNAGRNLTVGLTLPIVAFGTFAVKSASDLQETINKVDVAFKDSADSVKVWGKTTLKQFGIAEQTGLDMAALYGDMATGMGLNSQEASKLGMNLTGLAGDMASFKNVRLDVAKTALSSIFTGETESLKTMGIVMTQTNLEQFAMANGMKSNMAIMTEQEKIQLRYAYVVNASKNSIGDFARTSDSTANQVRTAGETYKELSATMGEQLLPMVNQVLGKIIELFTWFTDLDTSTQTVILGILGFTAVIGPLLIGISALTTALTVLSANPVILMIAGIIAIIGIFIYTIWYLHKNWGAFTTGLSYLWKSFTTGFMALLKGIGNGVASIFKGIVNTIIGSINIVTGALNILMAGVLLPFNAIILGLNQVPGVNIPYLKLAIPKIPKLATGTNNVQRDGLAYLHQGEAVVPKKYNPAMGGGQTITVVMPDIIMDNQKVGHAITPTISRTLRLAGAR